MKWKKGKNGELGREKWKGKIVLEGEGEGERGEKEETTGGRQAGKVEEREGREGLLARREMKRTEKVPRGISGAAGGWAVVGAKFCEDREECVPGTGKVCDERATSCW